MLNHIYLPFAPVKPPSRSDEDHEVRTMFFKILSNSMSIVGTWSKFV